MECKKKNNQVGVYQSKVLIHSKGSQQQNEKSTYWMGETIFKPYIW